MLLLPTEVVPYIVSIPKGMTSDSQLTNYMGQETELLVGWRNH